MEAEVATNGDRIYRQRGLNRGLRIICIATVALFVPIWIAIAAEEIHHEQPRYTALGMGLLFLGIFGFMFAYTRIFSRPKIVASSAGLTLVNYFSSKSVTWDQVEGFDMGGGQGGIAVRLKDGRSLLARGVQKSPIMMSLNRSTRADRVVEELNEFLRTARY